jgi:hypothetical protein
MNPVASHRGNDRVRWSRLAAESGDRVSRSPPCRAYVGSVATGACPGPRPSTEEVRNVRAQQPHGPWGHPAGRHGVLDYPLAAVLIVLPFVLGFDDATATWIAVAFGIGAAVLAVGTAWSTGIVRVIPPLLHGYADVAVTVALIVLPFIVGFWDDTTALVFYLIVGLGGLGATLATRFEPRMSAASAVMLRKAA